MPNIELIGVYEHPFINPDEKIRRMYSFSIGEQRADMMTVIEGDGFSRAYNMDNDMYFNGDKEPEIKIPSEILDILTNLSTEEIEKEYQQIKNQRFFQ